MCWQTRISMPCVFLDATETRYLEAMSGDVEALQCLYNQGLALRIDPIGRGSILRTPYFLVTQSASCCSAFRYLHSRVADKSERSACKWPSTKVFPEKERLSPAIESVFRLTCFDITIETEIMFVILIRRHSNRRGWGCATVSGLGWKHRASRDTTETFFEWLYCWHN